MVTTTEVNDIGTLPLNFLNEDEEDDDEVWKLNNLGGLATPFFNITVPPKVS